VRWYFVPQAVVIDGARGPAALTRSGQLVEGFWWRTFGLVLLANLAVAIPGFVLLAPFTAIADSADQAVWALVGTILATSVTTPFVALFSTLLYYDLLARRTLTAG
jgi:VIT1/CCC1 family predicted Fe2+/Mn2+ transporter